MSVRQIELRRADGSFTKGELHDELVPGHLLLVEQQWSGGRVDLIATLQRLGVEPEKWPQSLHWNWAAKARELWMLEAAGFIIGCDGKWQGAMLTKSATHASLHPKTLGKPLIYVDYVEVAPWNWAIEAIGQQPEFKGVGSTLIREAVLLSRDEEFEGRIGLHSLPGEEWFYANRCGMEDLGRDAAKEHMTYFELTKEGADRFLNGG